MLSDAHVHPSGKKMLCITCHLVVRTISHAGRSHVACAGECDYSSGSLNPSHFVLPCLDYIAEGEGRYTHVLRLLQDSATHSKRGSPTYPFRTGVQSCERIVLLECRLDILCGIRQRMKSDAQMLSETYKPSLQSSPTSLADSVGFFNTLCSTFKTCNNTF